MSTDYDLGNLELVPARSIWSNEAADFTPWLAGEESIRRLGRAIGLELEVEDTEVGVGPYSADILARDTATGDYVVIENQLEKINHDHLGKAIVYAATLDAGSVVWVATEFTEEHRRAVDWLNDNSARDVSFFAVRLEVWRIGGSKPAPRFNVVARPTGSGGVVMPSGLSETRKLQLEWWTHFRDVLEASNVVPSLQSPRPQYWYNVSLGRTGFTLSCIADTYADRIGVRLYMRGRYGGAAALAQLLEEKEEIEREIGHPLDWDASPDANDKTVASVRPGNLEDRSSWSEYARWLADEVAIFRRVFSQRVKQMDISSTQEESEEDQELP